MALLSRRAGLALVCALTVSCDGSTDVGDVTVELFDRPVECEPGAELCVDPATGEPVAPEAVETWALASTQSSEWAGGVYLYFELERPDGTLAHLELDTPRGNYVDDPPRIEYRELLDGVEGFRAGHAVGRVELPADTLGAECHCTDGRLELVLTDPGDDAEPGTGDDRVRRLSRGRWGWDQPCVEPARLPLPEVGVDVDVVDRCPELPVSSPPDVARPSDPAGHADTSCSAEGDGAGCEGDSSSGGGCEGDSSSGGGCEGDSSSGGGCEGDSSSGGCEGDAGGSGCSGDAGGGGASCSGDAGGGGCSGGGGGGGCSGGGGGCASSAAVAPGTRPIRAAGIHCARARRRGPLASGQVQLLLMIGLVTVGQLRRARRRAPR